MQREKDEKEAGTSRFIKSFREVFDQKYRRLSYYIIIAWIEDTATYYSKARVVVVAQLVEWPIRYNTKNL